jgi:hypothetical protein
MHNKKMGLDEAVRDRRYGPTASLCQITSIFKRLREVAEGATVTKINEGF